MSSIALNPKAIRLLLVALALLALIFSIHYFDVTSGPRRFVHIPQDTQATTPFPDLEELTKGGGAGEREKEKSKLWFFGGGHDEAMAQASETGGEEVLGAQVTTVKTTEAVMVAAPEASGGVKASLEDFGSLEEYIAPANVTSHHKSVGKVVKGAIISDTVSSSESISAAILTAGLKGAISPSDSATPSSTEEIVDLTPVTTSTQSTTRAPGEVSAGSISIPLILYAYSPAEGPLPNLKFFLKHALHGAANFIFIINGALIPARADPSSTTTNPEALDALSLIQSYSDQHSNVRIWKRRNMCFDLGSYAEVLKANDSELLKSYDKFIMINANLRGPFLPFWSHECWSDAYLGMVDGGPDMSKSSTAGPVKLVGMQMNCGEEGPRRIQSSILATDRVGMDVLLGHDVNNEPTTGRDTWHSKNETSITDNLRDLKNETLIEEAALVPRPKEPHKNVGINTCPDSHEGVIRIEESLISLMLSLNYNVRVMMSEYWSRPEYDLECASDDASSSLSSHEGGDLGVFETLFMNTRGGVYSGRMEELTVLYDAAVESGMSKGAWDRCLP